MSDSSIHAHVAIHKELASLKKQVELLEEFLSLVSGYYHYEPMCPIKMESKIAKKKLEELRGEVWK